MEKSGPRLRANRRMQQALVSLLRQVREEKGLRQEDVAESLGYPQSFVSKYESGERRLDLLELREVCTVLGISLADFVRRFEETLQ
jgi:transcriptional regulator with XRE-family HTH domain